MKSLDSLQKLNLDIRRTILLGADIRHWGLPEFRIVSSNEFRVADANKVNVVEVYSFPPRPGEKVHRIATVGMSGAEREDGSKTDYELFMTLPADLGGATFAQVAAFLMELFVYSLQRDVPIEAGQTIPELQSVPASWKPRALLLDEARGEPEELGHLHVGRSAVGLLWVIPIYVEEYDLIQKEGVEAFDALDDKSEWSLADVNRPSLVTPVTA